MIEYLDVKKFVEQWKKEIAQKVASCSRAPSLTIIQIGHDAASDLYVRNKLKDCKEVGIYTDSYEIPIDAGIETHDLCQLVTNVETDAVIVQLPVPKEIDMAQVVDFIPAEKDVDGFTKDSPFVPATAAGIMKYLDALPSYDKNNANPMKDGAGRSALVIGRSKIVGIPIAKELLSRNYTVTVAHSKTNEADMLVKKKEADLVVVAVGHPHAIDIGCCSDGCVIIDVGTNYVLGQDGRRHLMGDTYWDHKWDKLHRQDTIYSTPVPGGVGLLTRCALLQNVVDAYYLQNKEDN